MRSLCVFAGSNPGRDTAYTEVARRLGQLLAERGVAIVFGGGRRGLMGAVSEAALTGGGRVIGVIPRQLQRREQSYPASALTELHVVRSMHERKAMMARLSDGFLALPGGFGTFEEVCEMVTWGQLGIHAKPVVLLNARGYFDHLLALFDHALDEGFLRPQHRPLVLTANDPQDALALMSGYTAPVVEPWLDLDQT